MDKTWKTGFDQYGRQTPDPVRFPHGMKSVADHIHSKGLKAGIYLPVGLEKGAYGDGSTPIWNATGCTTADIVYPDLRTTNGWDNAYKIDFGKPCAQKYIDSQAQQFADWGYDFLKLDGVGPGSFKSGDNYDNVPDVAAWQKAIATAGRPIHLELSWSLDIGHAADWKKYSNGWRIDTDVECYCNTLVTWENSVNDRWDDAPAWSRKAGPGGWNDLDGIDVGNGEMDGLTKAERQSYMTLWAINKSPLFTGDDLTKLDSYGVSLLTNKEVIAVDQNDSPVARPVTTVGDQQVWGTKNADGSYTVALFNLADSPASVTAQWASLGFSGNASVRDLWNKANLGTYKNKITEALPAHGSRLFTVKPGGGTLTTTSYEAESAANTLSGNASVAALRRLLRRQEGRQPLHRRQAAVQRHHGEEGRHLHRPGRLRQRRPPLGDRLLQQRQRHQREVPLHGRLEHGRDGQRPTGPEGGFQRDHLRQRQRIRPRHRQDRRPAVGLSSAGGSWFSGRFSVQQSVRPASRGAR